MTRNHQNVYLNFVLELVVFSQAAYSSIRVDHLTKISSLLFQFKDLDFWCMASRRNIPYSRLAVDDDEDYYGGRRADPRFDYSPKSLDKIPWKSIALALFLLFLGCLLLLLSYFILSGHMGGERSQAYGLLGLGILTFLPGFYETRIAYYSWRGAQGYRFTSIPDY